MTVTMNTPAYLVGQLAQRLFDQGISGINGGTAPSGVLGSTLTIPFAFVRQALDLGFTYSSWTPG